MTNAIAQHAAAAQGILPGLLLCAVLAMAAAFISSHYGGPRLLYALLLGLGLNTVAGEAGLRTGINFSGRTLLRAGVVLLGVRVTIQDIAGLGVPTAVLVIVAVGATLAGGLALGRSRGVAKDKALLAAGAVGICGASAAMALAAVLPATRENERFTLMTIVGVTLLSTIAMVLYPFILAQTGIDGDRAGVVLGATIHDVAQVVGAGMLLGPDAVETATVVKLFRVVLLIPVVLLASAICSSGEQLRQGSLLSLLPGFLIAFFGAVLVGSSGALSPWAVELIGAISGMFLVVAIAAAGLKTNIRDVLQLGWTPVLLLVVDTVILFVVVVAGLGIMH